MSEPTEVEAGRPDRSTRLVGGIAGAAVAIAAITVLARVAGFGRIVVFSRTVGATCVGEAYQTANGVPNIVFEIVAGGALVGAVVPLLAGRLTGRSATPGAATDGGPGGGPPPGERKEDRLRAAHRAEAGHVASALLTWSLAVLTPIALIGIVLVQPVVAGLLGPASGCPSRSSGVDLAARMLLIFLPQIPLYGVAVVLSGVLQADRRFLGPALAPLLSSIVVAAAYVTFGAVAEGHENDLGQVSRSAEVVLAGGTTLGVAVLAGSLLIPLRRTGLALRPTLSFPPGLATTARTLAVAGLATVAAQQLTTVVIIALANRSGTASVVLYGYAWALYLLPYAVLAIPIATSAFPHLSARHDAGDDTAFAAGVAATSRAVVLASCLGAAVLAAVAVPVARVFLDQAPAAGGADDPELLAQALVGWAPGLIGFGLVAHLSRVLYARGRGREAAVAVVAGWAAVALADVLLVLLLPVRHTVLALGLGNAIGMTLAGALLAWLTRRGAGPGALSGLRRATVAGVGGGAIAAGLGWWVGSLGSPGPVASAGLAVAAALVCAGVYAAVLFASDAADLRTLITRRSAT
jgi:putative peptidoglycan lipid II flippase